MIQPPVVLWIKPGKTPLHFQENYNISPARLQYAYGHIKRRTEAEQIKMGES
jgi:hypothetical protein